jgi:hypothetical protein
MALDATKTALEQFASCCSLVHLGCLPSVTSPLTMFRTSASSSSPTTPPKPSPSPPPPLLLFPHHHSHIASSSSSSSFSTTTTTTIASTASTARAAPTHQFKGAVILLHSMDLAPIHRHRIPPSASSSYNTKYRF